MLLTFKAQEPEIRGEELRMRKWTRESEQCTFEAWDEQFKERLQQIRKHKTCGILNCLTIDPQDLVAYLGAESDE